MIIVDVYVPVYEKTYDMEIDEGLGIAMVIEEMATIICQKESSKMGGNVSELCLCDVRSKQILSPERCLRDYGITNGGQLLLVYEGRNDGQRYRCEQHLCKLHAYNG